MAVTQSHYRFGINELSESTHGWHAAEDTNPSSGTIGLDTTFLLRFCLQCDATLQSNVDPEFQYRKNGGTWTNITTTSNDVRAVTTTVFTNGQNTTQRLSGTGTFESSSAGCTHDGSSGGANMDIVASGNAETECSMQIRSADVAESDVLEFRLTRDGGTLLDTYAVTPSYTVPANPLRTATQTGTWSDTATWGGASVPAAPTNTVLIPSGFTVTVSASASCGTGSGTALTLIGSLVINAPFEVRGDVSQERSSSVTGSCVGSNTGSLTFRPGSGVTPVWTFPLTGSGTPSLQFTGEAGDLFAISTSLVDSGNRAYFNATPGSGIFSPTIDWQYFSVADLGGTGDTTATRALSYEGSSGSSMRLRHGRFSSNIGKLYFTYSGVADFTFEISNCDFRSPRNSAAFWQILADTANTTGSRTVSGNTFYTTSSRSVQVYARDMTFSDNIWVNTRCLGDISDTSNRITNDVFLFNVTVNGMISGRANTALIVEECIFGVDQTVSDNPHYVVLTSSAAISDDVARDNIVDGFGTIGSDSGDWWITDGVGILDRNLLINKAGVLFPVASTTLQITARRNTLCDAGASPNAGETGGSASAVQRFTSNLFAFNPNGIHQDAAFVSQTAFNCDYNGFWNMTTDTNEDHPIVPSNPNSYLGAASVAAWWTAGAFGDDDKGLHDVYGDPQFVDRFRTMVSWYNSIAGSGGSLTTIAEAMVKANGTAADGTASAFNSAYTSAACKAYLRAGYKPQNVIYYGAGDPDDGTPSLGAIDLDPPAPPPQLTFPRKVKFRRRVIAGDAA